MKRNTSLNYCAKRNWKSSSKSYCDIVLHDNLTSCSCSLYSVVIFISFPLLFLLPLFLSSYPFLFLLSASPLSFLSIFVHFLLLSYLFLIPTFILSYFPYLSSFRSFPPLSLFLSLPFFLFPFSLLSSYLYPPLLYPFYPSYLPVIILLLLSLPPLLSLSIFVHFSLLPSLFLIPPFYYFPFLYRLSVVNDCA